MKTDTLTPTQHMERIHSKLSKYSFRDLLLDGIWRTKKENGDFEFKLIEDMEPSHINRCLEKAKKNLNPLILDVLGEEIARRQKLSDNINSKIKNNTMNAEKTTQTEFSGMVDYKHDTTLSAAVDTAATMKSSLDYFKPIYEQIFKVGDIVDANRVVVEVTSPNNRGFLIKLKDKVSNVETYIPQSKLLKELNKPSAKKLKYNTAKKSLRSKVKKSTKPVKDEPKNIVHTESIDESEYKNSPTIKKYNVGDTVGKYLILSCKRSKAGNGGYTYYTKHLVTDKKQWKKQSRLQGIRVLGNIVVENNSPFLVEPTTTLKVDVVSPTKVVASEDKISIQPKPVAVMNEKLDMKHTPSMSRWSKVMNGIRMIFS